MNSYYNPVRTFEGFGCLAELPRLLAELMPDGGRVLILAWSAEALRHPILVSLLDGQGAITARSMVFTASNPTVEQLFAVWQDTEAFDPRVVVAVGGGSIMDVGKSLCCLYGQNWQSPDDLRQHIAAGDLEPSAQWIGVPTTAGTGSEVTCWATIWDPEQDTKRSLESHKNYAWAALVDPELTAGMPLHLAVSSALDAVAHAVESYWARRTNAVSRGLALEAIRTIMGNIDGLFSDSAAAHEAMARGSMLAGLAFSNTKTTACHSISYPLTMHYHIPHGTAVAMLLGPVMSYNASAVKDLPALLDALGVADADGLQRRVTELLLRSAQSACLRDWGVPADDLGHMASLGMTKGRADNNPVSLTAEKIESILMSV